MFGGEEEKILNEESILDPKSPYAASKVFSHNITKLYRESYGIFAVNGIFAGVGVSDRQNPADIINLWMTT